MCTFEVDVIGVDGQAVDRMGREKSDGKGSREGKGPEKEPGVGQGAFTYWYGKVINRNKCIVVELIRLMLTGEQCDSLRTGESNCSGKKGILGRDWEDRAGALGASVLKEEECSSSQPLCRVPPGVQSEAGRAVQSSAMVWVVWGEESCLSALLFQALSNPREANVSSLSCFQFSSLCSVLISFHIGKNV